MRTGDFNCFCKNLLTEYDVSTMENYKFPLDGKTHCPEWYTRYWIVIVTIGAIAILIIVGNIVIEVLVIHGSTLTRPVNEEKIMLNSIRAISWI